MTPMTKNDEKLQGCGKWEPTRLDGSQMSTIWWLGLSWLETISVWKRVASLQHLKDHINCSSPFGFTPSLVPGAVSSKVKQTGSLAEAQRKMLNENKPSILQEWHGLTVGLRWIVPQTIADPYHRPVKDSDGSWHVSL